MIEAIMFSLGVTFAVFACIASYFAWEDSRYPPQEEGEPSGWPIAGGFFAASGLFFLSAYLL